SSPLPFASDLGSFFFLLSIFGPVLVFLPVECGCFFLVGSSLGGCSSCCTGGSGGGTGGTSCADPEPGPVPASLALSAHRLSPGGSGVTVTPPPRPGCTLARGTSGGS